MRRKTEFLGYNECKAIRDPEKRLRAMAYQAYRTVFASYLKRACPGNICPYSMFAAGFIEAIMHDFCRVKNIGSTKNRKAFGEAHAWLFGKIGEEADLPISSVARQLKVEVIDLRRMALNKRKYERLGWAAKRLIRMRKNRENSNGKRVAQIASEDSGIGHVPSTECQPERPPDRPPAAL